MQVLTIAYPSELPRTRVLAESLREFHADWPITIVALANQAPPLASLPIGVRCITPTELGIDDFDLLTVMLDGPRLIDATIGPALGAVLREDDTAVFLDRSLRVTGPLDKLESSLRDSSAVVVPYLTAEADLDERGALTKKSMSHGVLHHGVLALRRGDDASAIVESWPGRALARPTDEDAASHDPFPAWFDAMPARCSGTTILTAPQFLAGSWNLADREIRADAGELTVDGAPVSLLDFGDFDPARPHLLSAKADSPMLSEAPALAELCARHASELQVKSAPSKEADPYARLPDGTELNVMLRWLAGTAIENGDLQESIFTPDGMREFYAWLNAPAEHGSAAGLTRYHEAIWNGSREYRGAYPFLDGPDGPGFAGWLVVHGPERLGIPADLLPPTPPHVNGTVPAEPLPWGVNVAGFFRSELGLGEAARLLIGALDAVKVPTLPVQGALIPPTRQGAEFAFAQPDRVPFPINVICMNGDTIPVFARETGRNFFENRYSIALWWWEVGSIPENWHEAFEYIDEVWVASDHVYKAIAPVSPVPVVKMPMPVIVPRIESHTRAELGMPEDKFTFLYVYDYHSTSARKNPVGLVRAFHKAFPPGSGAALVLKCINAENLPQRHEEVLVTIAGHPDIHVIDRFVSAAEKDAMIAACDCYVSLHRSEGFGLTPAEAMWLGKPVIATRYGGTLEFMTPENSYLVDHKPIKVGENAAPYPPDGIWADPDIDQAAEFMRHVFEDRDEARARGLRAFEDIHRTNAPEVAGRAMEQRLRAIYDKLPGEAPPDLSKELGAITENIPTRKVTDSWWQRGMRLRHVIQTRLRRRVFRREAHIKDAIFATMAAVKEVERRQSAAHAETLGGFRRTRGELTDVRRQVSSLERFERELAESRALPFIAESRTFESWSEPPAGTVVGFRDAMPAGDARYRAFEDTFRGSHQHVKRLMQPYADLLAEDGPVLDVGCGRGEMLELLAELGIEARGIDLDAGMVEHCRATGHANVELADAVHYLDRAEPGSLGALFSAQVVEHIPYDDLVRLLDLAVAKLRPGGLFIAETVNVHAPQSMKTFWVDPTHQHPLFPETMLELCRNAGFASGYVFHPGGAGSVSIDRFRQPAYAVVARTPRA
ncbi:MAG: glycosyltransferase [Thermoleophilia bacterium]|nr:glycosyltransferase [Thermoleophilia bacterium]